MQDFTISDKHPMLLGSRQQFEQWLSEAGAEHLLPPFLFSLVERASFTLFNVSALRKEEGGRTNLIGAACAHASPADIKDGIGVVMVTLQAIVVSPDARGRGVATSMLDNLCDRIEAHVKQLAARHDAPIHIGTFCQPTSEGGVPLCEHFARRLEK